jgi:hypothetical protein
MKSFFSARSAPLRASRAKGDLVAACRVGPLRKSKVFRLLVAACRAKPSAKFVVKLSVAEPNGELGHNETVSDLGNRSTQRLFNGAFVDWPVKNANGVTVAYFDPHLSRTRLPDRFQFRQNEFSLSSDLNVKSIARLGMAYCHPSLIVGHNGHGGNLLLFGFLFKLFWGALSNEGKK